MTESTVAIKGRVVNTDADHTATPYKTVELWSSTADTAAPLATATTTADGAFEVVVERANLPEAGGYLFLKVYSGNELLTEVHPVVDLDNAEAVEEIAITIPPRAPAPPPVPSIDAATREPASSARPNPLLTPLRNLFRQPAAPTVEPPTPVTPVPVRAAERTRSLRLCDRITNQPLTNQQVRAFLINPDGTRTSLGIQRLDASGRMAIELPEAQLSTPGRGTTLRLEILGDRDWDITPVEITSDFRANPAAEIGVQIDRQRLPYITEVHKVLGASPDTLTALRQAQITTVGALLQRKDRPPGIATDQWNIIRSRAELTLLSNDTDALQAVTAAGINSLTALARSTPESIPISGEQPIAQTRVTHLIASARSAVNFLEGQIVERGGYERIAAIERGSSHSALGPVRYLKDLVDYAVEHIRENNQNNWAKIDTARLEKLLYQPFSALLKSKSEVLEAEWTQLRLALEVVVAYYCDVPQLASVIEQELLAHSRRVYANILARLGVSETDLTVAWEESDQPTLTKIADRVGITVQQVGNLVLDKNLSAQKAEDFLYRKFGLPSLRDPLKILAKPEFASWREARLCQEWQTIDWGDDSYGSERTIPVIDPDVIGLEDIRRFRDFVNGKEEFPRDNDNLVFKLWNERVNLRDNKLKIVKQDLQSPDPLAVKSHLENHLGLSLDRISELVTALDHRGLMVNEQRQIESVGLWPAGLRHLNEVKDNLSASVDDVADIIWQAQKRRTFKAWITEEKNQGIVLGPEYFWLSLSEPTLHKWRTELGARTRWREALTQRSQLPLLEPRFIAPGSIQSSQGRGLFEQRRTWVENLQYPSAVPAISRIAAIENAMGASLSFLDKLHGDRKRGHNIDNTLAQLQLTHAVLEFLVRHRDRLATDPLPERVGKELDAIVQHVLVTRQYARWRDEEKAQGIYLLPQQFIAFKLSASATTPPSSLMLPLTQFVDEIERRSQLIAARQTQLDELPGLVRQLAIDAEAEVLSLLRDPLVKGRLPYLSDRFLIDPEVTTAVKTTRIAFAITTLQVLMQELSSGRMSYVLPKVSFSGVEQFQLEWAWLGNYDKWRGVRGVYCYPENLLQPELRPPHLRSLAFEQLINVLEDGSQLTLTGKDLQQSLKAYFEDFADICSLEVRACCYARVVNQDTTERYLITIAKSRQSQRFFVGVTPTDSSRATRWGRITPFDNSNSRLQLVGAVVHTPERGTHSNPFLYIFMREPADIGEIVFARFDLEVGRWEDQTYKLDLPTKTINDVVLCTQSYEAFVPRLLVKDRLTGKLYLNFLDEMGTCWRYSYWDETFYGSNNQLLGMWQSVFDPKAGSAISRSFWLVACEAGQLRVGFVSKSGSFSSKFVDVEGDAFFGCIPSRFHDYHGGWLLYENGGQCFFQNFKQSLSGDITKASAQLLPAYVNDGLLTCAWYHDAETATIQLISSNSYSKLSAPYNIRTHWWQGQEKVSGSLSIFGTERSISPAAAPTMSLLQVEPDVSFNAQLARTQFIQQSILSNLDSPTRLYIEECFYSVPHLVATYAERISDFATAAKWLRTVYDYDGLPTFEQIYYFGIFGGSTSAPADVPVWLFDSLNPHAIAQTRKNAYPRFTLTRIAALLTNYADNEFAKLTPVAVSKARRLYQKALQVLAKPELTVEASNQATSLSSLLADTTVASSVNEIARATHTTTSFLFSGVGESFYLPDNAVISNLKLHAEANLNKIRTGRSITGTNIGSLWVDLYTQSDSSQFLGAQFTTYYRYATLMARAKELANQAERTEAAFLNAAKEYDEQAYTYLKATQDLEIAAATNNLQSIRVEAALGQVLLAGVQTNVLYAKKEHYINILNRLAENEKKHLDALTSAIGNLEEGKDTGFMAGAAQTAISAGQGVAMAFSLGPGALLVGGFTGLASMLNMTSAQQQMDSQIDSLRAQYNSAQNSYEQLQDEWKFQVGQSELEIVVSDQVSMNSKLGLEIAQQELSISYLATEHARETVEFLAQKFGSKELYAWMRDILAGVFRYFLREATVTAQLAASQLAFERQQPIPAFIQSDYWSIPSNQGESTSIQAQSDGKQGLTASVRLLRDLYRLEQFAFQTYERRLKLRKTISLAVLDPFALQKLRETGVVSFVTPMKLFDRDHPGHYSRLIKSVGFSITALVPPTAGVQATLTSSGISRVVVVGPNSFGSGSDSFHAVSIVRDPETIPISGVVELPNQTPTGTEEGTLQPFEGTGVETTWTIRMPKASNLFDYDTIFDITLFIEYTALESMQYRYHVQRELGTQVSLEKAISVRREYPDAWYDLHNAAPQDDVINLHLPVSDFSFPNNLSQKRIEHVLLYVSRAEDTQSEMDFASIELKQVSGFVARSGSATTIDGIVSTRQGNGLPLLPLLGIAPQGEWAISVQKGDQLCTMLDKQKICDIFLILTYSAELPAWPA
ncbi:MAG: hypothetical protein B0A82_26755 [Alkalinema sp. CACIAM 70d]|nr:MAG: hypothetical protein B0A82_26755 [Alkalinema sp. CACIAM 70d]